MGIMVFTFTRYTHHHHLVSAAHSHPPEIRQLSQLRKLGFSFPGKHLLGHLLPCDSLLIANRDKE
jgi:hypothetical protein